MKSMYVVAISMIKLAFVKLSRIISCLRHHFSETVNLIRLHTLLMSSELVEIRDEYEEIFQQGKDIINKILRNSRGEILEVKHHYHDKNKNLDCIQNLMSAVSNILKENHYQIDNTYFYIDFHGYSLFGGKYSTPFDWHQDEDCIGHQVITAILYLRKDETIKGGNLIIDGSYKIIVKKNTMVIMDGKLEYKPEDLEGFGCRDSIVFHFKNVKLNSEFRVINLLPWLCGTLSIMIAVCWMTMSITSPIPK